MSTDGDKLYKMRALLKQISDLVVEVTDKEVQNDLNKGVRAFSAKLDVMAYDTLIKEQRIRSGEQQ